MGFSMSALASDPIFVVRPDVPGIAAGVLSQDAFSADAGGGSPPSPEPEHPNVTKDWSTIPVDQDGFIYKSAGYASSAGTFSASPIKIAFGPGDLNHGNAYDFRLVPKGPAFYPPVYVDGATPETVLECVVDVARWDGGPKNLTASLGFQYGQPPVDIATINVSFGLSYPEFLQSPIKVGLRMVCDVGLGGSDVLYPGSVDFTQDFEITYSP